MDLDNSVRVPRFLEIPDSMEQHRQDQSMQQTKPSRALLHISCCEHLCSSHGQQSNNYTSLREDCDRCSAQREDGSSRSLNRPSWSQLHPRNSAEVLLSEHLTCARFR